MQEPVSQTETVMPEPPTDRPTLAARLLEDAAVLVFFTILSAIMLWPLIKDPAHNTTDVGVNDALLNARFIKEIFDSILSFRHGVLDANFFFPHPAAFATTDPGIGVALLALPLRLFTSDYLVMVNLVLFATFPLCAYGTYRLVREIGCGRLAAVVSGTAFAFCFYRFHQLDHVTILQMQWIPLTLLFLHRIRRDPTVGNGLGFTFFFVLNALGSSNIGLYTTPAFAVIGLWVLAGARPAARGRTLWILAGSCCCAAAVLIPVYAPFLTADRIWGLKRAVSEIDKFSAHIGNFFSAPSYNWLYGKKMGLHLGGESAAFVGATVLALVASAVVFAWGDPAKEDRADGSAARRAWLGAVSIVRWVGILGVAVLIIYLAMWMTWAAAVLAVFFAADWARDRLRGVPDEAAGRRSLMRLYLFIAVAYVLLSVGPNVFQQDKVIGRGLWRFIMDVPGFGAIRTPARFFLMTAFSAAVLAGFGAQSILESIRARWVRLVAASALMVLIVFEAWSAPLPIRRFPSVTEAPEVYRWLAAQPGPGAVLELPLFYGRSWGRHRMYYATVHGRPTVDAESSFLPPVISWISPESFQNGTAAAHLERLAGAGLRFVIVRGKEFKTSDLGAHLRELGRAGARVVKTVDDADVYELPPGPKPEKFSPDKVVTAIRPVARARRGFPLEVFVDFAPKGGVTVFEKRVRRLSLSVTVENRRKKKRTVRVPVYLAPPLLAPSLPERVRVEVPLPRLPAGSPAALTLTDEDGRVWAEMETRVSYDGEEPSAPTKPCAVDLVSAHVAPSGLVRGLVRVANSTGRGWDDGPRLVVSARASDGVNVTQVYNVPAGPGAAGSEALASVEVPPRTREIVMRVGIPGAPPLCERTAPLPSDR